MVHAKNNERHELHMSQGMPKMRPLAPVLALSGAFLGNLLYITNYKLPTTSY